MSGKKLSVLRDGLITTARQMGKDGASTAEIISAFRSLYASKIKEISEDLENIALVQLLNEGRTRRAHVNDNTQESLFSSFNAPNQLILRDEVGSKKSKNLEECSLAELTEYIDALPTRQVVSARKGGLIRLRDTISPFQDTKHNSVGKCWQAYLDSRTGS